MERNAKWRLHKDEKNISNRFDNILDGFSSITSDWCWPIYDALVVVVAVTLSFHFSVLVYGFVFFLQSISEDNRKDGRAAIFLKMERLPEQHGLVVQTLAWWEELYRCKLPSWLNWGAQVQWIVSSLRWHWLVMDRRAKPIRWFCQPAVHTSRHC